MKLSGRDGYTLAEALVALVVAGVLIVCLAVVLGVVGRAALRHAAQTAAAETERAVPAILGAELRTATAADFAVDSDSVRLRAFRGRGIVCASESGSLSVSYSGSRLPEDDKDSVLVITATGEAAFGLAAVAAGGSCPGESLRLALSGTAASQPEGALVALIFETGAYSIAASAFRYRRGHAGRQPLTEENLSTVGSHLDVVPGEAGTAAARLRLRAADARRAAPADWRIGMLQGAARPQRAP